MLAKDPTNSIIHLTGISNKHYRVVIDLVITIWIENKNTPCCSLNISIIAESVLKLIYSNFADSVCEMELYFRYLSLKHYIQYLIDLILG